MKWYKIMNNEVLTYTVMKNYVTENWELTFISLKLSCTLYALWGPSLQIHNQNPLTSTVTAVATASWSSCKGKQRVLDLHLILHHAVAFVKVVAADTSQLLQLAVATGDCVI